MDFKPPWWTHMWSIMEKCVERGVEYGQVNYDLIQKWMEEDSEPPK